MNPEEPDNSREKTPLTGPIAWMAQHSVAANLAMIMLIVGGIYMSFKIQKEVFPEFTIDVASVSVGYPGASPEEVEKGIVLPIEEAVRGLEGVKEVASTASEGGGSVRIELDAGINRQKIQQDLEQRIRRIRTFPRDAEAPEVELASRRREVLQVGIYGDLDQWNLRQIAEQVRDNLLLAEGISQVEVERTRDYIMHIEVPQANLRAYGLTLEEIASKIGSSSLDVPGGRIQTTTGEILLRVKERREWADEFAAIPIITTENGSVIRLRDIATITDGFDESNFFATYESKPTIDIEVYRIGDETPISISEAVHERMEEIAQDFPPGVEYHIHRNRAEIYHQRLELLLRNGFIGLCLVMILLGIFLEYRLAAWVTIGMATSFVGGLLFLPWFGVSINMISMFAFLIALGIVVDDAIVAGENIYAYREKGYPPMEAAIRGAQDIAMPVTYSIITNCVAFAPMFFIPGVMGKIWWSIPAVVITVFLISLFEALFILPAHLAHTKLAANGDRENGSRIARIQGRFHNFFRETVDRVYSPIIIYTTRYRYITIAVAMALMFIVIGYIQSNRIGMVLMPEVDSDEASASAELPAGSTMEEARRVADILTASARQVVAENGGDKLSRGISARIRGTSVSVDIELTPPGIRTMSVVETARLWRESTEEIIGLETLQFESEGGFGGGRALTVDLSHENINTLERASRDLAERLRNFAAVRDVVDEQREGNPQLDFIIRPEGRSLGFTPEMVGRQVRAAFFGAEARRMLRGRNEIRLRVKLPEDERTSEHHIENLMLRAPSGAFVPLTDVAEVRRGQAFTSINRRDGRRVIRVTTDVRPRSETTRIITAMQEDMLPQLTRDYPGLMWSFQGRQASMRESTGALMAGFGAALFIIYALLAISFRSYVQPLIVILSIPFGIIGAMAGHILLGFNLSLISLMGVVALSGVVVNDSLIMVDYANKLRKTMSSIEAIRNAAIRRFRPILLTTLTTFGGLAPMIFETSRQARFIVPMAISLGFGILFATAIILIIVPAFYVAVDDVRGSS